ncbi:substrate-binding domain-containing protein [Oscillospiraceae bacterium PP1C4]
MKNKWLKVLALSLAVAMSISLAACSSSPAASSAPAAETSGAEASTEAAPQSKEGGYKIGWSTIYLTPSWMQQTKAMMDERVEHWKAQGIISEYTIANANGDTSTQISQIENMISQGYDAIILIAGSSTALNTVVDKCAAQGVVVVNIDSLVTTDKVTCTINTSATEHGQLCAQWLVDKIGGKGEIVLFNGPAGVAVSDERQAGAQSVLAKYPDVKVVANLNTEYNEAPALEAINPVLDTNPNIAGILSLGGAMSSASLKAIEEKGMNMIPITGENYNAFMKNWDRLKAKGFSSFAVGQPNWLGVLAVDQCVRILNGDAYEKEILVPLPQFTDDNLSKFVPNDLADDGFTIAKITEDEITKYLTPKA